MNLFIDALSSPCTLILFDDKRQMQGKASWNIKGNESSVLIPKLEEFLKYNTLTFFDLENIIVVNWPGSFTWVRTIVLMVNAINYLTQKNMTSLSYFQLFNRYPIIKSSSKRDCFFQKHKDSEIEIMPNDKIVEYCEKNNIRELYWEARLEVWNETEILDNINYWSIIQKINFESNKQLKPLYIKKPNIS